MPIASLSTSADDSDGPKQKYQAHYTEPIMQLRVVYQRCINLHSQSPDKSGLVDLGVVWCQWAKRHQVLAPAIIVDFVVGHFASATQSFSGRVRGLVKYNRSSTSPALQLLIFASNLSHTDSYTQRYQDAGSHSHNEGCGFKVAISGHSFNLNWIALEVLEHW
ncbi:hypothetical protein K503DRAFT_783449 [Rhizopogon vinicolor AM-OR11-026]|uniref:Uncharacterized protein n=1 Tax=Rhizopogon vinicolor AM-OR11-026 TaxID=1314800 RepID=A0A1B7MYM0_9AGAM|nr:hypothetical protein K503DRAFT_783449 [Rhizopogon vinicolor AM-OR11-026]